MTSTYLPTLPTSPSPHIVPVPQVIDLNDLVLAMNRPQDAEETATECTCGNSDAVANLEQPVVRSCLEVDGGAQSLQDEEAGQEEEDSFSAIGRLNLMWLDTPKRQVYFVDSSCKCYLISNQATYYTHCSTGSSRAASAACCKLRQGTTRRRCTSRSAAKIVSQKRH